MVLERVGYCAHTDYLCDFIPIRPNPKIIKNAELAQKYLQSNLSAQQLADEYGVSKQMILGRLRAAGVHGGQGRGRAPNNFRFPNPIFGMKAANGRLETNSAEMKIVRLIVELRDRQGWSFEKITAELNMRGLKNRKKTQWYRAGVGLVYKNWASKV